MKDSCYFASPWTGGNPKQLKHYAAKVDNFASPWTGGNPKLGISHTAQEDYFASPWTGGNPKLLKTLSRNSVYFASPWTGGQSQTPAFQINHRERWVREMMQPVPGRKNY